MMDSFNAKNVDDVGQDYLPLVNELGVHNPFSRGDMPFF
jgi:hypothetical protein